MGAFKRTREKLQKLKARIGHNVKKASLSTAALNLEHKGSQTFKDATASSEYTNEASRRISHKHTSPPTKIDQRRFGLDLERGVSTQPDDEGTPNAGTSPRQHTRISPRPDSILNGEHNDISVLNAIPKSRTSRASTSSLKRLSYKKPVMEKQAAMILGLPENVYITPADAASTGLQSKRR